MSDPPVVGTAAGARAATADALARASGRDGVLHLAPWVDLGGADKGTIDWFRTLDRERFSPSLICTQPSPNRWLGQVEPHADEVWVLPDLMPGREFAAFVLGFVATRAIRVVHVMHSRLGLDLIPDLAALAHPPAIVVQLHLDEPGGGGYVPYAAQRYAQAIDAFSVSSRHLAGVLARHDVPADKVHVIPTGVDAEREFHPGLVEPHELGPGPHVLWAGRLVHQKDPITAVEVAGELAVRGVAFVLHVVGEGEDEGLARARAAELGLGERVAFHPPTDEIARWLRSCDVTLMTSRYEGVPYLAYESLAMERPVVAPALPGVAELLDATSGALVPAASGPAAYADALAPLLADAAGRARMGTAARERMRQDYSLGAMGRAHGELYGELLAQRPARAPLPPTPAPLPLRMPRPAPPERTVTVIVTNHELGRYLPAALASVRAQTLPAHQVIVVDDASRSPETLAVLDTLGDDVELIRLAGNLGPSGARNVALERATGSYVIPLDADDELLPDALESMVAQLERAGEEVAFVYPNHEYVGTRSDAFTVPDFNLVALRNWNYCHTTSLFDRRVFDAGVRYGEERAGHEDWDLVLTLGELGLQGVPADGPTFRYRRRGFSRLATRLAGDEDPDAVARRRHPYLYDPRSGVKAQWAPALSIVLHGKAWPAVAEQSCRDFEVVAAEPVEGVVWRQVGADRDPEVWLTNAVVSARGRWVLVASEGFARALRRPELVEHVLRTFWHSARLGAVAYAAGTAAPFAFAQLEAVPPAARPVAVAWSREWDEGGELALGVTDDLVADVVLGLQATRRVQWRAAP